MRIRACIFRRYDPREENGSGSICDYDEWLLLCAMSSGCVFHGLFLAQTPLPALQNWRRVSGPWPTPIYRAIVLEPFCGWQAS
jgi:hypothetical protein